ncbi:thiamine pyrophosphate-dependent enzyme, partial [Staphylococcus arlettae]
RLSTIQYDRTNFDPEIKDQFNQDVLNDYADTLNTELIQSNVVLKINEIISANSNVITSAGSLPGDLQRLWNATVPNTYHVEYGYSCMGYEISGALGVKLAEPENEVYSFVGDGSFLMLHSEFVTSLQYKKKINLLLFDNSGYGCINNLQMENGVNSYHTEFRTSENEILNIDYAKVAEGYGAKVYKVYSLEQLEEAIKDAEQQEISTLIEIKVLPKTMTDGYESWWHVGVPEVSASKKTQEALDLKQKKLNKAKQY